MSIQEDTRTDTTTSHGGLLLAVGLLATACAGPAPIGTSTFSSGPSVGEDGDEDSDDGPFATTGGIATGSAADSSPPDSTSGPDSGHADDDATSGEPDPTAGDPTAGDPTAGDPTAGDPEPECDAGSVCCNPAGMFIADGNNGQGCTSECSACNGLGGCEPRPNGYSCGGGSGTCDGSGGCDVPTCNDGAETIEPGEECDGDNMGGQTCESQGFDGGSLTCHANCTFDTGGCHQASIVPSRGLMSWTPAFTPDTNCTCSVGNPDCRTLYRGKVNSIVGNTANMEFRKMDGTNPSVDVTYWVVVGDLYPTCLDVHAYVQRDSGIWQSTSNTLTTSVNIWPSQVAFDNAPCGDIKDLFVITGGAGQPNVRTWYQEQAVRFTKICT